MTKRTRTWQADTNARQRQAYAIAKHLAMASGHMRHERDTDGFERWVEEFWAENAQPEPKPPTLPG